VFFRFFSKTLNDLRQRFDLIFIKRRKRSFSYKIFHSAVPIYFSNIVSMLTRFLISIVFARFLGVHDYGLLILAMAIVTTFHGIFEMRSNESITKYAIAALTKKNKNKFYLSILISAIMECCLGLLAFLVIYFFTDFIAGKIYHNTEVAGIIKIYAFVLLVIPLLTVVNGILQALKKFDEIGWINNLLSLTRFILPIIFIKSGLEAVTAGYVLAYLFTAGLASIITIKILMREIGLVRINFKNWVTQALDIFKFNFQLFISTTIKSIVGNLDVLLLGYFVKIELIAYYKIALALTSILNMVTNPAIAVIYPYLTSIWERDLKNYFKFIIKKVLWYTFLILFPAALLMFALARYVVLIFYGNSYLPVVAVFRVLLVPVVLIALTFWLRPMMLSIGKPKYSICLACLNFVLLLFFGLCFIPKYSILGMAWAYLLANVLSIVLMLYFIIRYIGTIRVKR
jgi:O-antigen/teichoic acid export membrane protein